MGDIAQPTPDVLNKTITINSKLKGIIQKDILFNRGNTKSCKFSIIGSNQLPKPPIKTGIIIKKIMTKPWVVTTELKKS